MNSLLNMNSISDRTGFKENNMDGLVFYTIPAFEETGLVRHGFSSRLGGVSTGECTSLNLGFKRKDNPENVRENFNRFCKALDVLPEQMIFTDQVHKDNVWKVDKSHRGMGFERESTIRETDGLITNQPGLALVTFYADCVPLFFLDRVNKVIGLSHSGWRGTVAKIGRQTLMQMEAHYGSRPSDCLVGIGPSIGSCCFEVDQPVAEEFAKAYDGRQEEIIRPAGEKFHIDLWKANAIQLMECGVPKENITTAALCTCCKNDIFFSHRGEKGKTGSMAALLMLI